MYRFVFAALAAAGCLVPTIGEAAAPTSCAPDGPAVIARSITPEKPPIAQISRASGTVMVRVDLSANGTLVGERVARSSGNVFLDKGALDTVKALAFAPGSLSCTHTGGSYTVEVSYPD